MLLEAGYHLRNMAYNFWMKRQFWFFQKQWTCSVQNSPEQPHQPKGAI